MSKIHVISILCLVFISGCTLAGDLTPPASIATSQAAQPIVEPTEPRNATPTAVTEQIALSAPNTESGASLYAEKCAPCHGETGLGDGSQAGELPIPASPIGDPDFAQTAIPMAWYEVVSEGRLDRFMPAFQSLNDQQRWDVVAFSLSLSSQPMDILLGQEVFTGACAECHGEDATGTTRAPDLTRFDWITQRSLEQIVATIDSGISPGMPEFGETLSTDEQIAVARYIFNLSFPTINLHTAEDQTPSEVEASVEETAEEDPTAQDELIEARISGQITNGTEGGASPESLEVTLYGFDGQQPSITEKTLTDETGEFLFEGVEIQPGRIFVTAVEYLGATYASEVVHMAEEFELDLPITIYDTTTDLSQVQVDRLHLIFDMPAEGVLQVTELWILSNLGDRTVADETGEGILLVQLPEDAVNVGFEDDASSSRFQLLADTNTFLDRLAIRPGVGGHEIVVGFTLPLEDSLSYSQFLAYPVEAVVLLVPQGVVELEGDGIEDLGLRQMSGTTLRSYGVGPIAAGDQLELVVKRDKAAQTPSSESNNTVGIVLGISLLLIALAATGVWLDRRIQRKAVRSTGVLPDVQVEDVIEDKTRDRERLLQELADLDDEYEAGKLGEQRYQNLRNELKDRLMETL